LAEKPFTEKEKKFMIELSKSKDATIEVIIPTDIDPKEWDFSTSMVCRALYRAETQESTLKPILGRLLLIAKENPAIYAESGCETFDAFLEKEITGKWGFKRASCYEFIRNAEFSIRAKLTSDDLKEIGRVKMRTLTKLIPKGKEGQKRSLEVIEKAKELPIAEFEEWAEKKHHVDRGSASGAYIKIPCNKAILKRWEKFSANADVQAVCKSGNPGEILDCMMAECKSSWLTTEADGTDNQPAEGQEPEESSAPAA
jgi:hypothetical protein